MNDVLVTLPADGNAIDETGYVWTFLDEAPDPERIHPGAVIVAGDADAPFMARVVDLVDKPVGTIVHLEIVGVPDLVGGAMGVRAMIPVAGGAVAIGLDMLVMHVLSTALTTRVAYSYGFDVKDDEVRRLVDRMVLRAYRDQVPKAQAAKKAGAAFNAAKDQMRRSDKLLKDHRLLAAVDKLTQQFANGKALPIDKAAKGMPYVAIVAGAGTNAYVLRYGLPLPENLRDDDDE